MLKRTALAGLGLVLLVSPLLVSADTLSDLQAQINALLAQINQLKSAQSTTVAPTTIAPSTTPPQDGDYDAENPDLACVNLQYNLRYRSTDAQTNGEVSVFQDFLQSRGYLKTEPTSFFGLMTVAAAKKYQASVGLDQTGYVGPLTRAKIKDATCGIANPTQPTQPPQACPMTLPVIICEAGSHSGGWCNQECVPDGNTGAPVVKGIEGPASLNAG